ncbi:MAG: hypothetical protein AB8H03_06540 [Saprospiraceae bacterium]
MKNLITINAVNFKNDLPLNFKNGLLFLTLFLCSTMAISQKLITGEIIPKNIEGKVLMIKNVDNSDYYWHSNPPTKTDNGNSIYLKEKTNSNFSKWVFFHVGTDEFGNNGNPRHYYTIANYATGSLINTLGDQVDPGDDYYVGFTVNNRFDMPWRKNDQVFYLEESSSGKYKIIPNYNSDLSIAGPKYLLEAGFSSSINTTIGLINRDEYNKKLIYNNLIRMTHHSKIEPNAELWNFEIQSETIPVPQVQKATNNLIVTTPNWNSTLSPSDSQLPGFKTVGKTTIPYFKVKNDFLKFHTAIKETPYYTLERQQRYTLKSRLENCGTGPITKKHSYTTGFSSTQSQSFATHLGIKIGLSETAGMEGESTTISAEVSTDFTWNWTTSTTSNQSEMDEIDYTIEPYNIMYLWQIHEKFLVFPYGQNKPIKAWILPVEHTSKSTVKCTNNPNR